jgi:hypothetical protein
MDQARITLCIIITLLGLLIKLGSPAQAQLAPPPTCNTSPGALRPNGTTGPPITSCTFQTKAPAVGGNFIYEPPQIPGNAEITSVPYEYLSSYPQGTFPSLYGITPGQVCYHVPIALLESPPDYEIYGNITCVPTLISGTLSMTDQDTGKQTYVPEWGNACWTKPYALFYSACPATCPECVNAKYLIADASIPIGSKFTSCPSKTPQGTPNISEGFSVTIPLPTAEFSCGVTPNDPGSFTEFGNCTNFGQDVPGICTGGIPEPEV